jgi:OmpA-OmpF porin, OOP family
MSTRPFARPRSAMLLGLVCLTASWSHDAVAGLSDVPGSKDHSMMKRYEGSVIIGYDFRKFGDMNVLLGPVKSGGPGKRNVLTPTKTQRVEGQTTRILYVAPEGRSPLEVLRNYQLELQKAGFEIVYRCSQMECGGGQEGWLAEYYLYPMDRRFKQTPASPGGKPVGQVSEFALSGAKDQQFFTAKRTGSPGDAYASVYAATGGFKLHKETFGHAMVLLDVVETAPMETRMVKVDAAAMAKDIHSAGKVALYGIYFDTNSDTVKPESAAMLQEIALLLKQEPALNLYVVGHTDNVGGFDYNMDLSRRRAASVVAVLTAKHGVAAQRLKSGGVGLLAPVAPNESEDGRAKNRRVELVKQ